MKKLVLLLAVAFSVSMFSCGKGDANKGNDSVPDTTVKENVEQVQANTVDTPAVATDSNTVAAE